MKRSYSNPFAGVLLAAILLLAACSKMDAYKEKYVKDGEKTYTGRIDSISMFSGRNRVKFMAQLNSDPRITQYKVYWGGRADSVTVAVTHAQAGELIERVIENIPESEQTFEFVTFDANGNKSISSFMNATSYGSRYQESLINRRIINSVLNSNLQTEVSLVGMDKATGVINTEIRYLSTTGDSLACHVPLATLDTFLVDHKYGSEVIFRSWYQPDSSCIDTFYTAFATYQPVSGAAWIDLSSQLVKNAGSPFQRSIWDNGRWGILADWTTSADVKNAGSSTYGGYEYRGGAGVLSMEGGWGLPAVNNGKIYQVVHLPYAGKWRFSVPVYDLGTAGTKYIAVNFGSSLPDYANVTTSTYYYNFSTMASGGTARIEFEVTEAKDVCIGFVANMPGTSSTGSYFKVRNVSLAFLKE